MRDDVADYSNLQPPTSPARAAQPGRQPPTSNFPRPARRSRRATSNFQLPTSNFQLPTSNFQLPTSNFQLPTPTLALSDGAVLLRPLFGAPGTVTGEVVFNTSLTGYQEI